MNERRSNLRIDCDYAIEYRLKPSRMGAGSLKESVLSNISGGGVLIRSEESHTVGSLLALKIIITGQECPVQIDEQDMGAERILMLDAEVVHVDYDANKACYWVGAKFVDKTLQ
ncbi:MAG: PilZ domain-containing protein [Deltaproteobacteria bacterium]|nr:PilZ domain-containing protein [Deltaproteobacteria bacterium]